MPEASIDKHHHMSTNKSQICDDRYVRYADPGMLAKSETSVPEFRAQPQLRPGIGLAVRAHDLSRRWRRRHRVWASRLDHLLTEQPTRQRSPLGEDINQQGLDLGINVLLPHQTRNRQAVGDYVVRAVQQGLGEVS